MKKPLILVSNDDGISSKGIKVLVETAEKFGDIVVVAPERQQSAMGHAITISHPIYISEFPNHFNKNVIAYQCSGTPADCIKVGKVKIFNEILKIKKPDLLLTGINHGVNNGLAILYSGTMSGAIEGAIEGIPSIGFSLCDFSEEAQFEHIKEYIEKIVKNVLDNGLPKYVALNVNFPKYDDQRPIKGVRIVRQTKAKWNEVFDNRETPIGKSYVWFKGDFNYFESEKQHKDNDEWALNNDYVSIVPCQFDLTSHPSIEWLKNNFKF